MPATCCFSHSSFVMGTIRRAFLSSSTDVCGVTAAFFVSFDSLAFFFSFFFSFFFWRFFCFFSFFFLRLFLSLSESELLLEDDDDDEEEERDLFFRLVFLAELSETLRFFALDSDLDVEGGWSKRILSLNHSIKS